MPRVRRVVAVLFLLVTACGGGGDTAATTTTTATTAALNNADTVLCREVKARIIGVPIGGGAELRRLADVPQVTASLAALAHKLIDAAEGGPGDSASLLGEFYDRCGR